MHSGKDITMLAIAGLIFSICLFGQAVIFAEQPPVERWVARYNGSGNVSDETCAVSTDNSGNVYVTGASIGSGTNYDFATIKYDSNGNEKWVARYNGPANSADGATAMAIDNSGNVYVTGHSWGSYAFDYVTIKYDSNGNEKWVARYSGTGNNWDRAYAIAIDKWNNIYVTGESDGSGSGHDYATVKYDSNGNQKWVARYNGLGNDWDQANDIAIDNSGNIYVTGYSVGNNTDRDYATIKYDPNGNQKWVARYNGPGNSHDEAYSIALDNYGNVYVTGGSYGSGTNYDYATIKYDSNGNEKWVARYNGPASSTDEAYAIAIDNSNNVYITGKSVVGTSWDYATIKYDSGGNEKWVAFYNRPGNTDDSAHNSIAIDHLGNVYIAGQSSSGGIYFDYTIIKYDSNGNQKWVSVYNGLGDIHGDDIFITVDNTGNVYISVRSYGSDTYFDYVTIKYTQHGVCLGEVEGDLNKDCKVDFKDFAILVSHWMEKIACAGGSL